MTTNITSLVQALANHHFEKVTPKSLQNVSLPLSLSHPLTHGRIPLSASVLLVGQFSGILRGRKQLFWAPCCQDETPKPIHKYTNTHTQIHNNYKDKTDKHTQAHTQIKALYFNSTLHNTVQYYLLFNKTLAKV